MEYICNEDNQYGVAGGFNASEADESRDATEVRWRSAGSIGGRNDVRRRFMRRLLVVSIALPGLSVGVPSQQRTRSIPTGVTAADRLPTRRSPVPRLPDGRVDLTGPWVGGGPNQRTSNAKAD